MAHTPFGYKIVDGKAVIDEEQALQLTAMFQAYIGGAGLVNAAKAAGINKNTHSSVGRILRNEKYLGTDYYPAIIDKKLFEAAENVRKKRAVELGRLYVFPEADEEEPEKNYKFTLRTVEKKYDNPFMQAEYAYSMIESEVVNE